MELNYCSADEKGTGFSYFYLDECKNYGNAWDGMYLDNGELLCTLLNENFFEIILINVADWLDTPELPCPPKRKKEILSNFSLFEVEIKKYLSKIDMEKYKKFINYVFLEKDEKLNTEQKYAIYQYLNKDFKLNWAATKIECYQDLKWHNNEFCEKQDIDLYHINQQNISDIEKEQLLSTYILENKVFFETSIEYSFNDLEIFLNFLLYLLIKESCIIKICKNCGRYFSPYNRSDAMYCDNKAPQDGNKTCKQYGALKAHQDNLKNNEAMGLYRKIYMAKQMMVKRNPDIQSYTEEFEQYKIQSKQWKKDIKDGIKTDIEYLEWLKVVKEKKV